MFGWINQLWIKRRFAGVWEMIGNLKLGFAGAKREVKCVLIFRFLRDRIVINWLAIGRPCLAVVDGGAIRQEELEILITLLRAGRFRLIIDGEQTNNLQLSLIGLKTHDIRGNDEPVDFLGGVVHLQFDAGSSGRCHAMVRDTLMDSPDQVRTARIFQFEAELAIAVGLGAPGFLHSTSEGDKNNFIAASRFTRSAVRDRPIQRLGRESRRERQHDNAKFGEELQP